VKVIREWDGEAANDQFGWITSAWSGIHGFHSGRMFTSGAAWPIAAIAE